MECSPDGCVGLIVNRPSLLRLGVGRGGLKFSIIGAPAGMQDVFADQRVYCGGMIRQDVSGRQGGWGSGLAAATTAMVLFGGSPGWGGECQGAGGQMAHGSA